MTLVGKIFTVLILVMSVAFMMLAVTVFATHRNWRDFVLGTDTEPGLKSQIEDVSARNRSLQEEIQRSLDRLAIEQAARRFALAALQTRLQQMEVQRDDNARQLADLQAAHGVIVETLNTNQMVLEKLTGEVGTLRGEIQEARQARDAKFQDVVRLTEEVHRVEGIRQTLLEQQNQLLAQVSRMQVVLNRNDLTEFDPIEDKPPLVDGIVTAVGETDLIEISIGADDGLREGHQLEVYRNNSYLGKIVIQRTEPDKAVGKILREYRKGIIRKGDRVATRLS